jgi:sugar phosphate isomerase/epimerase
MTISRRKFLATGLVGAASLSLPETSIAGAVKREPGVKLKLALNAYSFDKALREGSMNLVDAVHFCAHQGLDALDATGYYFPGYPAAPSDEHIYEFKRTAYVNGVAISGTGVNNDFAVPDSNARRKDVELVKTWIVVASKLGASAIRIFSGRTRPKDHSFDEALEWMVEDFKECAAYGEQHGVMVILQQHNDFLKTAAEVIRVIESVGSEWFASILDVGSLRTGDPYTEIEKLEPYAVSWQIKEHVYRDGEQEPTDLLKIRSIIERSGYRGYLPFEALGPGNTENAVAAFLDKIRQAFGL